MKRARRAVAGAVLFACSIGVSAQQEPTRPERPPLVPPGTKTGNPTPGTPQPDPPNLANRITLVGCVQMADSKVAAGNAHDPNNPSDARFVLAKAARKDVVPPGTGTAVAATSIAGDTYRLRAIDSQLSPFVGTRVEISGEVQLAALPSSTDGRAAPPILDVQFVQKIAASCS